MSPIGRLRTVIASPIVSEIFRVTADKPILLSMETMPLAPLASPYDVLLLDADGVDVLRGAGKRRSPIGKQHNLVMRGSGRKATHMRLDPATPYRLKVLNVPGGATVEVSFFFGSENGVVN
jgi:hypothetical protein